MQRRGSHIAISTQVSMWHALLEYQNPRIRIFHHWSDLPSKGQSSIPILTHVEELRASSASPGYSRFTFAIVAKARGETRMETVWAVKGKGNDNVHVVQRGFDLNCFDSLPFNPALQPHRSEGVPTSRPRVSSFAECCYHVVGGSCLLCPSHPCLGTFL